MGTRKMLPSKREGGVKTNLFEASDLFQGSWSMLLGEDGLCISGMEKPAGDIDI